MVFLAKTRLSRAIKSGNTDKIAALIKEGVDINASQGGSKMFGKKTPLHIAVLGGREDVVDFLLKNGAQPDPRDGYDWTPLHHAANRQNLGVVLKLLHAGADPNLRTAEGRTAFGWIPGGPLSEVGQVMAPYMKKPPLAPETVPAENVPAATQAVSAQASPAPGWSLLSDNQVAHVETHEGVGYRLTDIFNFRNRERIRIVHNLETKADQASSLCFDDLADATQVEAARAELLRRGGSIDTEAASLQKPRLSAPKGG